MLDRRDVFERLESVLGSVVDSSTEVAAMPWARKCAGNFPGIELHDPLVLPGAIFIEVAASGEVLFGFDEIWVPQRVPVPGPSELVSIVAPLNLSTDSIPEVVAAYVSTAVIRIGLGDGEGLNFVGTDTALAVALGLR